MNFNQIQQFEYAINSVASLCERAFSLRGTNKKISYVIYFKYSDEIFTGTTLRFDEQDYLSFNLYNEKYYDKFYTQTILLNDGNPFYKTRSFINEFLKTDLGVCTLIIDQPEIFMDEIIKYVSTAEIKHGFEMPQFVYNFSSIKNNYSLPFLDMSNKEIDVVSIKFLTE